MAGFFRKFFIVYQLGKEGQKWLNSQSFWKNIIMNFSEQN